MISAVNVDEQAFHIFHRKVACLRYEYIASVRWHTITVISNKYHSCASICLVKYMKRTLIETLNNKILKKLNWAQKDVS